MARIPILKELERLEKSKEEGIISEAEFLSMRTILLTENTSNRKPRKGALSWIVTIILTLIFFFSLVSVVEDEEIDDEIIENPTMDQSP